MRWKNPLALPSFLQSLGVNHVVITGDLTTTSSPKEFAIARAFIERCEEKGCRVFLVPGNHDHYTKRDYEKKLFYRHFSPGPIESAFNLRDHGVTAHKLGTGWTLVALDTVISTSLTSSNGNFSDETERHLKELLQTIPSEENILLINHFPLFQSDSPRHHLWRSAALRKIVEEYPNIRIYLHGHTHRRCVADLRKDRLPIILDSGSLSLNTQTWHLLDLRPSHYDLKVYQNRNDAWRMIESHHFSRSID